MALIKCRECGNEYSNQASACPNCGCPTIPNAQRGGVACPVCYSHNITYQVTQTNAKTSTKGNGCLWGLGRAMLVLCTCGLWLLIGPHISSSNTSISTRKTAICQNCGHSWIVR